MGVKNSTCTPFTRPPTDTASEATLDIAAVDAALDNAAVDATFAMTLSVIAFLPSLYFTTLSKSSGDEEPLSEMLALS